MQKNVTTCCTYVHISNMRIRMSIKNQMQHLREERKTQLRIHFVCQLSSEKKKERGVEEGIRLISACKHILTKMSTTCDKKTMPRPEIYECVSFIQEYHKQCHLTCKFIYENSRRKTKQTENAKRQVAKRDGRGREREGKAASRNERQIEKSQRQHTCTIENELLSSAMLQQMEKKNKKAIGNGFSQTSSQLQDARYLF